MVRALIVITFQMVKHADFTLVMACNC